MQKIKNMILPLIFTGLAVFNYSSFAVVDIIFPEKFKVEPIKPQDTDTTIQDHMSQLELARRKNDLNLMLEVAPTSEYMSQLATLLNNKESPDAEIETVDKHNIMAAAGVRTPADFVQNYFGKYGCTNQLKNANWPSDNGTGHPCESAGDDAGTPNSDYVALDVSNITNKEVLESEELQLARDTAINITQPVLTPLIPETKPTAEKFVKNMLNRAAYLAPLNSYNGMINMRRKIGDITYTYTDAPDGQDVTIPVSEYSLMKHNSTYRVADPNWAKKLAVLPEEAILREIAYIQATALYNQFLQYEQAERMEAVMAQLASKFSTLAEALNFDSDAQMDEVNQKAGGNLPTG